MRHEPTTKRCHVTDIRITRSLALRESGMGFGPETQAAAPLRIRQTVANVLGMF